MKKKMKKLIALVIAVAMMFGVAAMVVGVLAPARADDEGYTFLYKPLDVEFYAATYPDLAPIANDPYALWMHYMEHGMAEGRIPYPGAEPGVFADGYTELNANATKVTDNTVTRDLSDWTPAQLAMLAQKQAEFDASGLVHVGWTEDQVKEKLDSLRTVYPEGSIGGYCDSGSGKIAAALYGYDPDWFLLDEQGLLLCDKDGMRVMPVGFVECQTVRRANGGNIRDVRVGDMIDTNGSGTGHVQIVLSRDEYGITVVESNQNSDKKFHWGRRISWTELENGGNNIYQQQNKWTKYVHYLY